MNKDINIEQNSSELKIGKDIYLRILGKAIEQTESDMENLVMALKNDDQDQFQAITHRWKGDYDNLRITELSAIAKQLNDIAKVGIEDREVVDKLVFDFGACFGELKSLIA